MRANRMRWCVLSRFSCSISYNIRARSAQIRQHQNTLHITSESSHAINHYIELGRLARTIGGSQNAKCAIKGIERSFVVSYKHNMRLLMELEAELCPCTRTDKNWTVFFYQSINIIFLTWLHSARLKDSRKSLTINSQCSVIKFLIWILDN